MCASSTISRSFWASIYCLHSYKDYPLLYQNLVIWLKFLAASFSIIGFLILVVPLHLKQCDLTSGPPHYPSTTQTKWLYRISFLQNIFLHFFLELNLTMQILHHSVQQLIFFTISCYSQIWNLEVPDRIALQSEGDLVEGGGCFVCLFV